MSLPFDSCDGLPVAVAIGGCVLALVGLALFVIPTLRQRIRSWLAPAILGVGVAVAVLSGGAAVIAGTCPRVVADCSHIDPSGMTNLLANPALAPGTDGAPVASWVVSGTLAAAPGAGQVQPSAGSFVQAALVRVRPGAPYCYAVDTGGSGHGQAIVVWWDVTLGGVGRRALSENALPPQPAGRTISDEVLAPPGAAYATFWLRAADGTPSFHAPWLAENGVRVESWPDGAPAALAFSFDWESAMGGLIHSFSGHDPQDAVLRGLNMRAGADTVAGFFHEHNIRATFYATGYNLLDGNTERRQFAGNPIYKFGIPPWQTTWWLTNTWYSDDPYGTVASDPAWYFGDQTDRLRAAGHEIGSHTFGHLYVRGTRPISLSVDLDEWVAAAQARKLPPLQSFAFPWQSSNSLTPDFYQVLAQHGITSVTRLYPGDLRDDYVISAAAVYSPMLVMPDWQLGVTGPNTGEGGVNVVTGTIQAQAVLSETIARRGVTSFWNHPEVLTLPDARDTWQATIAAAAQARDRGDLWIAPVSTIMQRWRDSALVDVTTTSSGDHIQIVVTNRAPDALDGVTLTLPRPAQTLYISVPADRQRRPEQVILPRLVAGQTVQVDVDLAPETPSR